MLTRRSLGRDSGTTLDNKGTYNIRRSRTSKMFGCCLRRRVVGVWGQSPREPGCRDGVPAGCGQSPRFVPVIKRKLPPCGRHLPPDLLYGNIPLSRSGRIFSINRENLHPTLDNIRLFSRSVDKENPGF